MNEIAFITRMLAGPVTKYCSFHFDETGWKRSMFYNLRSW